MLHSRKLLELLSVSDSSDEPQIKVRLHYEQSVDLIWKLDTFTTEQLAAVFHADPKYKYRLSLQSFWDANQNHFSSSLTKTNRDHSEQVFFTCSEEYVQKLSLIKELSKLSDLKIDAPTEAKVTTAQQVKPTKIKGFRTALAIASLALILLVGFSSYSYLNQTVFAKNVQEDTLLTSIEYNSESLYGPFNIIEDDTELDPIEIIPEPTVFKYPSVELDKIINYRIPAGTVALTFDDGPSKYTKKIADILNEYEVGGTFFFIGNKVKKFPDSVDYVHTNGFMIGNHSTNHAEFNKLSLDEQIGNIVETNNMIEQITTEPVILFRPPYGANNTDTTEVMSTYGMKMVLWNSDTEDWKSKNAEEILKYVTSKKASGSIILLHETEGTVQALPQIIEYLQEQQLDIVNLK